MNSTILAIGSLFEGARFNSRNKRMNTNIIISAVTYHITPHHAHA